jgi:tRNA threonylcarbamoyladenosine biosynthesis protein TsaB
MLTLTIKTDSPEAEVGLYANDKKLAYTTWQAHRILSETIHKKIELLLKEVDKDWTDIQSIICFKGPGSFTGLRIGLAVGNSLAYSLKIPIVGSTGQKWIKLGLTRLQSGEDEKNILPEYGSEAHITQQKK